ncbi:PE-PGRS family protein [Mycobacterium bohemicum DSM 44277]|uniref:PE-PGRS family protein n=1 Tax=Mycobacterium bohemicum DSM 44277 TaxID=1236609 RepID=A0A0U0W6Q0_MYCBE|nr:PE family protein [Mycobacterium bohemicum]CPR07698.1 PE-PGRS family protein [Mycobacterium bohemicum DSM 44277]
MSFVVAVPDLVEVAAQDLAGIRASLADVAAAVAGPTTGVVPAAADEVSAAIAAMFGSVGQEFQAFTAQAQAFHAEFVKSINAGAAAYLSTEVANAEQALANAVSAPAQALSGGSSVAAASTDLLGGLLGGGTSGGLLGGLTGSGGLLGGLTGSGGLLSGLGGLGSLGSTLGSGLNSLLSGGIPGFPSLVTGLENSLTGVANSLLPGLIQIQTGAGPYYSGLWGPYQELFADTWANLQNLGASWLADPFPFLRQVIANQIGYGQIIATAFQTGNLQPISAIPGDMGHNFANVIATLTNTSVTSSLDLSVSPLSATVENAVGLPLVFGASVLGPPVAALEAAGASASAFTAAMQAGNGAGAFAALFDAPAVITNAFLNGQATYPYALNLSSLTGPAVGQIANVSVVGNFPLDGLLHPPGYYPVTVTVTLLNSAVLPPLIVDLGVGSTPFTGLLPFLINYAPQQLAQAIGPPAPPPPLISLPILSF